MATKLKSESKCKEIKNSIFFFSIFGEKIKNFFSKSGDLFYINNGNNSTEYSVVNLFFYFLHFGEISHKKNPGSVVVWRGGWKPTVGYVPSDAPKTRGSQVNETVKNEGNV
jgi:hypothetical protein